MDIEKKPPIGIGLVLAAIYILVSSAVALSHTAHQMQFPSYVIEGIDLLGYFCVVSLIFSAGKDLKTFQLERFSLVILIIFPGFLSSVPSQVPTWAQFLFMVIPIGIGIFLYLRLRQQEDFRDGTLLDLAKYLLLGTGIAFLFFTLANLLGAANQINTEELSRMRLLSFISRLIASLSSSAAIEETIFRGFLLGFLINKRGLNPFLAITIQSLVFWIPHAYQYNNPFSLQVLIPVFGMMVGWVTFKTKNITTGILAHALYNALLAVF